MVVVLETVVPVPELLPADGVVSLTVMVQNPDVFDDV
jgi:hypothetical protein